MVNVFGESGYPTRKLLEMSFGRFGSFALEPGFKRIESLSSLVSLLSRMHLSIRINGEILNTKINTKNTLGIIRRGLRDFDHNAKVENASDQNKVCLASDPVKPGFLVFSKSNRDDLSTFKSDQRYLLQAFPGKDSLVIDNGSIKPKLWFNGLISLVGFTDLGNGPDRELGGKTKMFSNWIVNPLMDLNLVGTMQSKNRLCYVITSLVEPLIVP